MITKEENQQTIKEILNMVEAINDKLNTAIKNNSGSCYDLNRELLRKIQNANIETKCTIIKMQMKDLME